MVYCQLGTIFPITFAAIFGQAIRRYTAWRLERGTRLAFIEQMMGSLTIGGALSTTYALRALNVATVILLAVWTMSPLGSQASLLMITTQPIAVTYPSTITYLDTVLGNTQFSAGDLFVVPTVNALYNACLLEPNTTRNSDGDLWGNVKIPDITKSGLTPSDDGWLIRDNSSRVVYSSLLGIPVLGLSTEGNTTFSMETTYLSLSCTEVAVDASPMSIMPPNQTASLIDGNHAFQWFNSTLCETSTGSFTLCLNGFYNSTTWGTYGAVSLFGNGSLFDFPAALLSFQSIATITPLRLRARCPVTIAYVESSIFCSGTNCTATAIRPSNQSHPDSNYTALSFAATFQEFSKNLIGSVGQGLHDDSSSPTEFFLSDPNNADLAGFAGANFQGVTAEQATTRLQQIINTYWYGSFSPSAMMGGMVTANALNRTSTGTISVAYPKYVVQWKWFSLFMISAAVMAAVATMSLLLALVIRGPDVLGYASTMLSNSEFILQGRGLGSAIQGSERSRLLGPMRLRLADVRPDGPVGFIAIVEDNGSWEQGELSLRNRVYQ